MVCLYTVLSYTTLWDTTPGESYLFATRSNSVEGWHTFAPGYGALEVRDKTHADELRQLFTDAVENETVSVP